MTTDASIAEETRINLVYYNKWKDARIVEFYQEGGKGKLYFLLGKPTSKLDAEDDDDLEEWVIPRGVRESGSLKVCEIEFWFKSISMIMQGVRPKRITIGLVNDDSTIVYYFIHDGITQPRQN